MQIVEVCEIYDVAQVNERIKNGWKIHSVFDTPEKRVYILTKWGEAASNK